MIKAFATTLLISTTLATGALAQTAPTTSTTSAAGASGSMFVTDQKAGEFRASKFVGVDIYGSENQKIGDVNEILMDANGNAKAIVIGVGGFLGIGEKNVAVPFSAVEWKNERPTGDRAAGTAGGTTGMAGSAGTTASTTSAGTTTSGMAGTTAGTATGGAVGTPAGTTAITPPTGPIAGTTTVAPGTAASGTTASAPVPSTLTTGGATMTGAPGTTAAAQSARSPAETAAINGYPDHGMVKMTKADLENAPTFRYYADANTAANRPTGSGAGGASTTPPTTTTRQ